MGALIREATKRPKLSSTAEIGVFVHRTTLSRTLHRAGLYGRVARKKERNRKRSKHVWCSPKKHVGDSPNIWKKVL
jgi:hypothetical protein